MNVSHAMKLVTVLRIENEKQKHILNATLLIVHVTTQNILKGKKIVMMLVKNADLKKNAIADSIGKSKKNIQCVGQPPRRKPMLSKKTVTAT